MQSDIINNINILLEKFFNATQEEVFVLLDKLYKITPDILKQEPLEYFFVKDIEELLTIVLTSAITLFVLFYIF